MKLVHLSDLHIGKRVNEFSMIEDQKYILNQILAIIDAEKPDGVMIAGDVYDKTIPTIEAVTLLDDFLAHLANRKIPTFVISGNHDSPERIAFASRLIANSGVHISPAYHGTENSFVLTDEYGPVNIYMLPFVKPTHIRIAYPDAKIESYTDAVREAISHMNVDETQRNVIIAHQFVTGAERSESEELTLGGSDNVDVSVFVPFDYVALGHIHRAQKLTRDTIRYSGTPLKYSFSESHDTKSVTIVELKEKGNTSIRLVPLSPLHDMREIRGTYEELMSAKNYANTDMDDYVHITLTDEDDVLDAAEKLRIIYPNLMKLDYDNTRTRNNVDFEFEEIQQQSPLDLFSSLFTMQNGMEMSDEQKKYMEDLIQNIWS